MRYELSNTPARKYGPPAMARQALPGYTQCPDCGGYWDATESAGSHIDRDWRYDRIVCPNCASIMGYRHCAECGAVFDELHDCGGDMVCSDCADESDYAECHDCHKWFERNELADCDGDTLCEECAGNAGFSQCEGCHGWFNDLNDCGGNSYCRDCTRENGYDNCCACGDLIHSDDRITSQGNDEYCRDCYCDTFSTCEDCGDEVANEDTHYINDRVLCDHCAHRHGLWDPNGFVNHSGKYDLVGSSRCFGVEIETSECDDNYELEGSAAWGCKHDCSVSGEEFFSDILSGNDGLEAVTDLCDFADKHGWAVDRRCGLHIHLDMRKETEASLMAIAGAFRVTQAVWAGLVAQTRVTNFYCERCPWDLDELEVWDDFNGFSRRQTRYVWLNVAAYPNHTTFEVRLHQGSLNDKEIRNWVRALTTFADWASKHTLAEVRGDIEGMGTAELFDTICAIWRTAGCADLVEYYSEKARANGRFQPLYTGAVCES